MSVHFVHEEPVNASVEKVFAVIDDLAATAKWLPPCISLENQDGPPNAVGQQLKYFYTSGGGQASMDGTITHRVENERLCCRYGDKMFEVVVDLKLRRTGDSCVSIHDIEIIPINFFMKLMQPVIRMGLRKQTTTAALNLKKLVETGAV
jgi:Polyketide cyclase / dehydrase and lipid transport